MSLLAVPILTLRECFGRGLPNWHTFLRLLWMDWDAEAGPFTWFHVPRLWLLRFHLRWQPAQTGTLPFTDSELGEMSLHKAMVHLRWIGHMRKEEARAQREAFENARNRK